MMLAKTNHYRRPILKKNKHHSEKTKYTISGIIYDEYNSPLAKVILNIYEVDLRIEKLVGLL